MDTIRNEIIENMILETTNGFGSASPVDPFVITFVDSLVNNVIIGELVENTIKDIFQNLDNMSNTQINNSLDKLKSDVMVETFSPPGVTSTRTTLGRKSRGSRGSVSRKSKTKEINQRNLDEILRPMITVPPVPMVDTTTVGLQREFEMLEGGRSRIPLDELETRAEKIAKKESVTKATRTKRTKEIHGSRQMILNRA